MPPATDRTLDAGEADRFRRAAGEWWDPAGAFAPLHGMTPVRLDYILTHLLAHCGRDPAAGRPLAGLRILDAGCGGGLLAEPFCRLGATVLGVDPVAAAITAARAHAAAAGLEIEYRTGTIESVAGETAFDLVVASEVLEHVADVPAFLAAAAGLLAADGMLAITTLNRTLQSLALAVVAAERILRWLPPNTHDWRKFLTPAELERMLHTAGLTVVDRTGLVYQPLAATWRHDGSNLAINYAMLAIPAAGREAAAA